MSLRPCFVALLSIVALTATPVPAAHADQVAAGSVKKAAKHFQRGVALYSETDYRAALVEFRRAYEVAPNPAVLYNIGQAFYQLQNYAAALTTFERYLAEASAGATHRAEVEQTVETLKSRVGKLEITANLPDCEVTVDDELAGKTPFAEPILVSIGRRKVIALCDGHAAESRIVEVAAGDVVKVAMVIAVADAPTRAAVIDKPGAAASPTDSTANWRKIGWITTGVLAAGTMTTGALAILASRDLKSARRSYPVSANSLRDHAAKVSRYSLAADIFGAATLVAGGISLSLTLSKSSSSEVRLSVVPRGLELAGTFR
jgi:hypothetical protein